MNYDYCPLCHQRLEVIEVAPCMMCGHSPIEIEHALQGKHTYYEFRVFDELHIILCNFCQVDIGSWYGEYFGLPSGSRITFSDLQYLRDIPVYISKDKYCLDCHHRLALLEFIEKVRSLHKPSS